MPSHEPFVIKGKKQREVTPLEAVGLTDPDPYIRALMSATVKKTKEEMAMTVPVAPTNELRRHILSMSLFPSIYKK